MNLNDILKWISMNGLAAFLIGCFLCTIATIAANALIGVVRTLTGRFPAPAPIIHRECDGHCDCNRPCKCCEEGDCQVGCACASLKDTE
jgi:hypothetical protein